MNDQHVMSFFHSREFHVIFITSTLIHIVQLPGMINIEGSVQFKSSFFYMTEYLDICDHGQHKPTAVQS